LQGLRINIKSRNWMKHNTPLILIVNLGQRLDESLWKNFQLHLSLLLYNILFIFEIVMFKLVEKILDKVTENI